MPEHSPHWREYRNHREILTKRELAILQVGWLARSPYEWSHHVKIGHDFGVSDADIQALIDDTAGAVTSLGAVERCVLRAARGNSRGDNPGHAGEADWGTARQRAACWLRLLDVLAKKATLEACEGKPSLAAMSGRRSLCPPAGEC